MGGESEFLQLVDDVEAVVLELARETERLYKQRCTEVTLNECYQSNYDECTSAFPDQICPAGEQLSDPHCGNGTKCSRLWDYSSSRVSLPQEVADGDKGNPTDPEVIETVCFSRKLDDWFVEKNKQMKDYWQNYGLETPPMYFGAHNGAFRIYPAYRGAECGGYNPTIRPWYIAASSGPKNILMILDVSGSMNDYDKLGRMKEAAKRVVSTLTVADRIAVVPFARQPINVIAKNGIMYTATDENKRIVLDQIDQLEAVGWTNFYAAFQEAFNIFDLTLLQELHVECNSAILFLTDGRMTAGEYTESQVIDYVKGRLDSVHQKLGRPTLVFTYSVSEDADVDRFPRELACAIPTGVWAKIETEEEIFESLTSYYHLFALGLGIDKNENFTAWVEPYEYADSGVMGTTVSAPVYDRDKQPHLFLGVVGVDFVTTAIDAALGGGSKVTLDRIIRQSTAKCPTLEMSLCELESFRRRGSAGDEALCTTNCTENDFVDIEPQKCGSEHDYPKDLWANTDEEGLTYEERTCCLVGETKASSECPVAGDSSSTSTGDSSGDSSTSTGVIIGGVVGAVVVCLVVLAVYFFYRKRTVQRSSAAAPTLVDAGRSWLSLRKIPPVPPPAISPDFFDFHPSAPKEPSNEATTSTKA